MILDWKWFGNAAHFIGSLDCHFHLATQIGDTLVSTVGEYDPKHTYDPEQYKALGWSDELNLSLYETFVFDVSEGKTCGCGCGLPSPNDAGSGWGPRWSTPKEACDGHKEVCLAVAAGTWGDES